MPLNPICTFIVVTAIGLASSLGSAMASACSAIPSGAVWHFHSIEKSGGSGAQVLHCVATFGSGGNFSAPCVQFKTGTNQSGGGTLTGKLTLSTSCDLTGSIAPPSGAAILVKYGHVNGAFGSGVATHGTGANLSVLHFTLVKK
jgi:hypothetical protein